jgi:hypothetical protein
MCLVILRANSVIFLNNIKEFAIVTQKQRVFRGARIEFVNVTYLKFCNISPQRLYCLLRFF